jgi:hypothetical protein
MIIVVELKVSLNFTIVGLGKIVTFVTILGYLTPILGADSVDFSTDPKPYGKSLEEWAKEFWQWNVGLPPGEIPKDPKTNLDKCIVGSDRQGVMIFLLEPYDLTYSSKCNVSSEHPILVPLLIGECDPTVPEPRTKTGKIQDLWSCAKDADEGFLAWEVSLDNRVLFKRAGSEEVNANLKDKILVRNSSLFNITMPDVNRYEVVGGIYPAVVDGYYLILNPLSPGEHTLTYKFTQQQKIPGADLSYVNADAKYLLTVN